jgi:hypothetical protein
VLDNDGKHALIAWLITKDGKEIHEETTLAVSALIVKEADKATLIKARFGGACYISVFKAGCVEFPTDIKVKVADLLSKYQPNITVQTAKKISEGAKPKKVKHDEKKTDKSQDDKGNTEVDNTPIADREKYKGMYVGMIVGAVNGTSPRYGWKGYISKLDKTAKKIQVIWQVNRVGNRVNEKCTYRVNNFAKPVNTDVILTPHSKHTILPYKTIDMSAVCFATQTKDQGTDCGNYLVQYTDAKSGLMQVDLLKDITREEAINKGRELCAAGTTANVFKADLIAEIAYVPTVRLLK